MGAGQTLGYMAWIRMTAERPINDIVRLTFVGSLASIAATSAFTFAPWQLRLVTLFAALIPASIVLLLHYGKMHGDPAILSADRSNQAVSSPHRRSTLRSGKQAQGAAREVWGALASPILCSMALVLVAPVVSTAYVDAYSRETARTLLAQGANLFALAMLAAVFFAARKRPSIADAYIAAMPALATAVLASAFLEPSQRWFVLFIADACYCAVSFLVPVTVCDISQQLRISPTIVYGLLGGFVYLARFPEVLLALYPASPFEGLAPLAVAAILLYLLALPAVALQATRRRRRNEETQAAETGVDDAREDAGPNLDEKTRQACTSLAERAGLPTHLEKVLAALASGDSVKRVAEELGLSESSVRTYRRSIYAALGVHSMQELLDTVRAEAREKGAQD